MLNLLLPERADNSYRGQKAGLWLFGFVASVKTLQGLRSAFSTYSTATRADGIPVDAFPPGAAATVLALFAIMGLLVALMGALCILTLVRYRSLVPLMFLVLLLHFLGTRLVLWLHPLVRTGTPIGIYVNFGLFVLMLFGLALSLWRRASAPRPKGRRQAGLA